MLPTIVWLREKKISLKLQLLFNILGSSVEAICDVNKSNYQEFRNEKLKENRFLYAFNIDDVISFHGNLWNIQTTTPMNIYSSMNNEWT